MSVFLSLLCLAALDPKPATPAELAQRILRHVYSITSGDVVLTCESTYLTDGQVTNTVNTQIHCWFDGDNSRCDYLRAAGQPHAGREIASIALGKHITWQDWADSPRLAVSVGPATLKLTRLQEFQLDPRMLGLSAVTTMNLIKYRPESFLKRADLARSELRHESIDGLECDVMECQTKRGMVYRFWAVPSMDYFVRRVQSKFRAGKQDYVDTVDLLAHDHDGLWFARRATYERLIDGRVAETENCEVEVKSLNAPIDDTVFELVGMDIPQGTMVAANGVMNTWNGKELVPSESNRPVLEIAKDEQRAARFYVYGSLAVVAAVIALALGLRFLRA